MAAEIAARQERDLARDARALADQERELRDAAESEATAQRNATFEADQRAIREKELALAAAAELQQDRDREMWQNLARELIRLSATRIDDDLAALLARQAFTFSRRAPNPSRSPLLEDALQQAGRATPWSHTLLTDQNAAAVVALSRDGKLAVNGRDGTIEIWDLQRPTSPPRVLSNGGSGREPALFIAFSPDRTVSGRGRFSRRWRQKGRARGGPRGLAGQNLEPARREFISDSPPRTPSRSHGRSVFL